MAGKVKYHELSELERKKFLGEFYTMVSLLRSREEVKSFFKDLLTLSEAVMISRRIQIAKMLLGGHTYSDIKKKLKVGGGTINQVERWLNNGFGGYKKIIKRCQSNYDRKTFSEIEDAPFSLKRIRRKYPLHFLLINLLEKEK